MSADKHPAEVLAVRANSLADEAELIHLCSWVEIRNVLRGCAAMLRCIPSLEYERDQQADRLEKLVAENDLLIRHRNGAEAAARSAVHRAEGLEAERDQLRAEVEALRADAERLDWLADPANAIGNIQLPRECVEQNLHSLRDAIDAARKQQ